MKNVFGRFINRFEQAEEWADELENKSIEIIKKKRRQWLGGGKNRSFNSFGKIKNGLMCT